MKIDKSQVIELLKSRGDEQQAKQADSELPDQVDPQEDRGLLEKFGINPQDLVGKLGGLAGGFG